MTGDPLSGFERLSAPPDSPVLPNGMLKLITARLNTSGRNYRPGIMEGSTMETNTGGWVYVRSEPQLWTVGFYDPAGKWQTDSDHDSRDDARAQVAWLNGGQRPQPPYPDWEQVRRDLITCEGGVDLTPDEALAFAKVRAVLTGLLAPARGGS